MYQVKIGEKEVNIQAKDLEQLDIVSLGNQEFHLLQNGRSYKARLLHADYNKKQIHLEINGNKYALQIQDEYDQLVKKMGLSSGGAKKLKNVKAPMPGLILDILIAPGDAIAKGDQLLILEAMKMENVLKAEGEGVVKSIEVVKGTAVEKGQVLIELE